ncbi:MAG TPA: PQQ-dependent sugar dehydrogenase [Nocardioides sp.]|uniref:PQQ-dependent sugar dehydrogenase n=1 Tax=uncultured Nocardioides sp. TaxID=198441 RepID=UPI000EC298AF|nr:PQQ-dependent sugar dehydrogenase [uncultured Nocardioides sp.]HCB07733.1 glucose sorbosone dehydrogenase [Nocardioides sp.]HRD60380.1 PQQ-dependent sugar dehydrogenase [Nocardioides sp.]HRI96430.1 PQQ-dependent sugar dehydrogenase [Nocardioides sp.]HRK45591.1 PQQ-dependent sugar dehydrogenase [Nocardioides sp.]
MSVRATRRGLLIGGAAASLAACSSSDDSGTPGEPSSSTSTGAGPTDSTPSSAAPEPSDTSDPASTTPDPQVAGELATGLAVPWGIAFLPDGTALVGERDTGRLLRVGKGRVDEIGTLDVYSRLDEGGETGLLGLALDPAFADNRMVYAYVSTPDDNRIVLFSYDGKTLGAPEPILTGIGTSIHHNGGGLAFGPDDMLYAATGDAEDAASAPDTGSLDGKVLRMTNLGTAPRDNPFGNLVWSYGHRNVEGITFDGRGRLWSAEFGDKGADELNLIRRGKNYGWPDVEGSDGPGGYVDPLAEWPVDQCSPSGVAVADGRAWLGALQGECVWSVVLDGPDAGTSTQHLTGEYGRIRSVAAAPDGSLWVTTSNRDGRTDPRPGDDRILRVMI